MSDKKAKRTHTAGLFLMLRLAGAAGRGPYGIRLSAIPEAYWGSWVPPLEICKDAPLCAQQGRSRLSETGRLCC